MCGILARFDRRGRENHLFSSALDTLSHRGPDGRGVFKSVCGRVHLGHRLLRIMERQTVAQPIQNHKHNIHVIVNGEFYDEKILKEELEKKGYVFSSESDSELLIFLYEEYGLSCLEKLNGEFAFVLWDQKKEVLFAARDRFGIKPLYFWEDPEQLLIASESKALFSLGVEAKWDPITLRHIFTHQYPLPHQSLFNGISALPPGTFLLASAKGVELHKYWDISYTGKPSNPQDFMYFLSRAVRRRLRARAKRAVYLSGGIDSATILALSTKELNTALDSYTVRFSVDSYDESLYAAKIANYCNSNHHIVDVTQEAIVSNLEDAVWYGETFAINGQLPAKYILSKRVRSDGVSVILSGEGADEALLGYPHLKQDWLQRLSPKERHRLSKRLEEENVLSKGVFLPTKCLQGLQTNVPTFLRSKLEFGEVLYGLMTHEAQLNIDSEQIVSSLLSTFSLPDDSVYRSAYLWSKLALTSYILRGIGDGMEMAHSIEGRPPFLDHEFFSYCSSLSLPNKIFDGIEKNILRTQMRSLLPDWICCKAKHPFIAPPLCLFSSESGEEFIQDTLRADYLNDVPYIDAVKVRGYLDFVTKQKPQERIHSEAPLMLLLSAALMQKRMNEL
jgi:asparagine synthase (glutamine-hydrolysing)